MRRRLAALTHAPAGLDRRGRRLPAPRGGRRPRMPASLPSPARRVRARVASARAAR